VARKTTLVNAGGFDEQLARCDDYDMWLRVAFSGAKVGYTAKVQARLSGGRPGSLGESRAKMSEAYWRILEKALSTLPLTQSQRDLIDKRAAEIRARYLLEEAKQQLVVRQFAKARELLCEANLHLRRPLVNLATLGLAIAPGVTTRAIGLWMRLRDGISA